MSAARNTTDGTEPGAAGFSEMERTAVRERAQELKTAARRGSAADKAAADERDTLEKIAGMEQPDRDLAERVHALVTAAAPELAPRLWYGMPAYSKDGKVLCYFKNGGKYKMRYCELGFSDEAHLDDGGMWPSVYAVTTLTEADEERITALVKRAVA